MPRILAMAYRVKLVVIQWEAPDDLANGLTVVQNVFLGKLCDITTGPGHTILTYPSGVIVGTKPQTMQYIADHMPVEYREGEDKHGRLCIHLVSGE